MEIVLLILGLVGLWLGAEFVIRGTLDISNRYNISKTFLGLTLVAFGTNLPELLVVIQAAIARVGGVETSGLIVGETIGTAMSQITLILGVAGMFGVLKMKKENFGRDAMMLIGSVAMFILASLDGELSRLDGVLLILAYLAYFGLLLRGKQTHGNRRVIKGGLWQAIISLITGFALLIFASDLTIDNAIAVSERFNIAQAYIGLLVVGVGTSLPELATSLTAIRKKASGLLVGNLIGSNIFDVLFTLGVGTVISGFIVDRNLLYFDMAVLFAASALVVIFFSTNRGIRRLEAIGLISFYVAFFLWHLIGAF